jgi:hypothetical protein
MWISEAGTILRWFSGAYLTRSSGHILLSFLPVSGWLNRSVISWLLFCAVRFFLFFAYVLMTWVTQDVSRGKARRASTAENLTVIYEPTVYNPRYLTATACYRDSFTYLFSYYESNVSKFITSEESAWNLFLPLFILKMEQNISRETNSREVDREFHLWLNPKIPYRVHKDLINDPYPGPA